MRCSQTSSVQQQAHHNKLQSATFNSCTVMEVLGPVLASKLYQTYLVVCALGHHTEALDQPLQTPPYNGVPGLEQHQDLLQGNWVPHDCMQRRTETADHMHLSLIHI